MKRIFSRNLLIGFLLSATILMPLSQAFLIDPTFAANNTNQDPIDSAVFPTAYAQTSTPTATTTNNPASTYDETAEVEENGDTAAQVQDVFNSDLNSPLNNLQLLNSSTTTTALSLSPQDINAVKNNQVDTRVTDYLTNLVTPTSSGGMGLTHVKASSILKGHTTGVGKNDSETLAASEGSTINSTHDDGKAVDISEVGQLTCKVVIHTAVLGISTGSSTVWQAPSAVKVSWQTKNGAAGQGTPNANSLLGTSQQMTANGVTEYLNSTGNLDAKLDMVQGTDMSTIGKYIGANVLLKSLGVKQVQSDPLNSSFAQALGEAILKDSSSSMPSGLSASNPNDDYRLAVGRADLEGKLGLPPGSLESFGWQNVLTNTGKRLTEQALGLPSMYLDSHSLDDLNKRGGTASAFKVYGRKDDALNAMSGAVAKLQANDPNGFMMVGAHQIEDAFKLTSDQKTLLETAITNNDLASLSAINSDTSSPNLDPTTFAIDNAIPIDGLTGILSTDSAAQQVAIKELTDSGSNLLAKANPTVGGGITQNITTTMSGQSGGLSIKNFLTQIGAGQLLSQAGLDPTTANNFMSSPTGGNANTIAAFINQTIGQVNSGQITTSDVSNMFSSSDFSAVQKTGGTELDKGFGWFSGSGLQVMNGTKLITDASKEIYSNLISTIVGTNSGSISPTGDLGANTANAIIEQAFGIGNGSAGSVTDVQSLVNKIGTSAFQNLFGVSPSGLSPSVFNDPGVSGKVSTVGANLNVPAATLESFLLGQLNMGGLSSQVKAGAIPNITPDKILNYFNISDNNKPSTDDMANIIGLLTGKDANNKTIDPTKAIASLYKLIAAPVDSAAGFDISNFQAGFQTAFMNPNASANGGVSASAIMNIGTSLFVKAIGGSVSGITSDQLNNYVNQFKQLYGGSNTGSGSSNNNADLIAQQQQLLQLEADNGIDPAAISAANSATQSTGRNKQGAQSATQAILAQAASVMSPTDLATFTKLINSSSLSAYMNGAANAHTSNGNTPATLIANFLAQATGIPTQFLADANNFVKGDFTSGLAAMSFALWQKSANQYLPAEAQLNYADMRNAIAFNNYTSIKAKLNQLPNVIIANVIPPQLQPLAYLVRAQTMDQSKRDTQYALSDASLRRNNLAIPAGFTKTMFTGTDAQKTAMLQTFAISSLELQIKKAYPGYVVGTIPALIKGDTTVFTKDALASLLTQYHITLGPINGNNVISFYNFLTANKAGQTAALSDPKYSNMWTAVNQWMSQSIGIALPNQTAQAIYNYTQNGGKLDQGITGANGQVVVPSIDQLGKDFLISKLTAWADKEFKLPAGTTFQVYNAVTGVINASHALALAKAGCNGVCNVNDYFSAKSSLAAKQAALTMLVISIALQLCSACQAFFGNIDQQLGFMPGTTNAIVTGLIALALHLGPAGLYIAAAMIIMSFLMSSSQEFLCPAPPSDIYSQGAYDAAYNDTFTYGAGTKGSSSPPAPAPPTPLSASPDYSKVGTTVTMSNGKQSKPLTTDDINNAWAKNITFVDGNNPDLYEAWSRYFTGLLLADTLAYGSSQGDANKPRQVITFRRANAEFFAAQPGLMTSAFGTMENGNNYVGMGYSEGSTNTYAWVHIGFGGI